MPARRAYPRRTRYDNYRAPQPPPVRVRLFSTHRAVGTATPTPLGVTKTHKHIVPTATAGRTPLKVQLSGTRCPPRLYRRRCFVTRSRCSESLTRLSTRLVCNRTPGKCLPIYLINNNNTTIKKRRRFLHFLNHYELTVA